MNRLTIGIIGCGGIAQMMHLPHLADDERFLIAALADAHAPTLEAVGKRYHIPLERQYTDFRALLAQQDIEAVGIFHSGSHFETVMAALEAGKHIFVEKPLAWNVREIETIARAAEASDRIIQVGYHKLYDPAFAYARDRVREMRDLAHVRITMLHPADELGWAHHRVRRGDGVILEGHRPPGTWAQQVAGGLEGLAGGSLAPLVDEALKERSHVPRLRLAYGLMTVSLIHQIYVLDGFLGEPESVVSTHIWRDGMSIHALLRYPNDLHVSLDWHQLSDLKDYREEYAFFGNHDRVYLQFPSPYLRSFPSPVILQGHDGELAWEKRVIVSYEEAFRSELLAFYDNVRANRRPSTGTAEALRHARIIQNLIDAAQ
jgi:predicted dehydrogenase